MIFESVTRSFLDEYNYRFKKDYNDALSQEVFYFFCVNKYLPLMYIAFYVQSYLTLFSTLLTLVVLDQLKETLTRYFKTAIWFRYKVAKLEKEWKEVK